MLGKTKPHSLGQTSQPREKLWKGRGALLCSHCSSQAIGCIKRCLYLWEAVAPGFGRTVLCHHMPGYLRKGKLTIILV